MIATSLRAERGNRIDAERAERWHVAGRERDTEKERKQAAEAGSLPMQYGGAKSRGWNVISGSTPIVR
jgi:RPA family protein